jgi:hypothetical protein
MTISHYPPLRSAKYVNSVTLASVARRHPARHEGMGASRVALRLFVARSSAAGGNGLALHVRD